MFIFPIAAFIFLVLGLYRRFASRLILREAFLWGILAWSIVLILLTEGLSAFSLLSFPYLSVAWIIVTVVAMGFCVFTGGDAKVEVSSFDLWKKLTHCWGRLKLLDMMMVGIIMVILLCTALSAVFAPPNNWDSLVYHMGRVGHWIQNQTIAHYPTSIKTQIYYPPFAEWVILHFQILSGGDRFANCVQWFAMFGSAVAASLVTRWLLLQKQLHETGRAQLLAIVLVVTIPMGILQSSSTQNDFVLSLWLIIFVYAGLRAKNSGTMLDAVLAGGALGVALLTKALALIIAVPFVLWFFLAAIKKHGAKIIVPLIIAASLVMALNINYWGRNSAVCGHWLGEEDVFGVTRNQAMSPSLLVSNIVRNVGLHLGTSIKPLNRFNERLIEKMHHVLGLSSIDPVNTLGATPLQISVSTHEDTAGNFIQLLLFGMAVGTAVFYRQKFSAEVLVYLAALFSAFIVYNLLLKWQPAASRLHLPLFVLMGPWVAVIAFSVLSRRQWIVGMIIAIVFATAVPYAFRNSTRKLFSSKKTVFQTPRLQQYFAPDDTLMPAYQNAIDRVVADGCRQVGLRIGDNSWEYPFWVLMAQEQVKSLRMEHVDIPGIQPTTYPLGAFRPCAIIETGRPFFSDNQLTIDGENFIMVLDQAPVRVYLPQK